MVAFKDKNQVNESYTANNLALKYHPKLHLCSWCTCALPSVHVSGQKMQRLKKTQCLSSRAVLSSWEQGHVMAKIVSGQNLFQAPKSPISGLSYNLPLLVEDCPSSCFFCVLSALPPALEDTIIYTEIQSDLHALKHRNPYVRFAFQQGPNFK